ncbi:MAG TPA: DUF4402 domain-containing protein [Sphingomicrobium sp.]|nr:DUF4402 domain-containing protein [Sphingomicrobium sp.]
MTNMIRKLVLATAVAGIAMTAAPALAANPDQNANATARILRPLTLTWVSDFDLGTIVLSGSAPFSATVGLNQAGALTCPASVTCSGTTSVARYNVRGTQGQTVLISAPNVTLSSGSNTLTLAVSAPASVVLSNSGAPGNDINIGGSITVTDTTPDGVYSGIFNVTANYQ